MPLEHLQLLAVFEADQVARRDGLLDRHGRLRPFGFRRRVAADAGQRAEDFLDKAGKFRGRYWVVRDMGRDNLGCKAQKLSMRI